MAIVDRSFRPHVTDLRGSCSVAPFVCKKNRAVPEILRDFPRLWRILDYWSGDQAEKVKVSQDMSYLRLALSQRSCSTRFEFWAFAKARCDLIAWRVIKIEREDGRSWAEAIRGQISITLPVIENLVWVDWQYAGDVAPVITIFRDPGKRGLNEVIQEVLSITGRP